MADRESKRKFSKRERNSLESYVNAHPEDRVARLATSDYLEEKGLHRNDHDLALMRSDEPQVALMRTRKGKTKAVVGIHPSAIPESYLPMIHSFVHRHGDDAEYEGRHDLVHPTSVKRIIDLWHHFRSQISKGANQQIDADPEVAMHRFSDSVIFGDNLFRDPFHVEAEVPGPWGSTTHEWVEGENPYSPHFDEIDRALADIPESELFPDRDGLLHFKENRPGEKHGDDMT